MNILFVQSFLSTLALESLSAYLKSKGHNVHCFLDPRLFDDVVFNICFLAKKLDSENRMLKAISDIKPELICFSVIYDDYKWANSRAKVIKKHFDIPIVFGGIHPTSVPENVLENEWVDYVVVGEGEYPLEELANAIKNGTPTDDIKNLAYRKNGHIQVNELRNLIANLDSLPFPDKEILSKVWQSQQGSRYSTSSSRGCAHQCTYCCHSYLRQLYKGRGKYLRRRSVDNLIEELVQAKEKYNITKILFHDENFTMDRNWLTEFACKYRQNVNLPYFCWVTPDSLDSEKVELLEKSGCVSIEIGIQNSPDIDAHLITGRKQQDKAIKNSLQLLSKSNFFVTTDNIIGLPGQKPQDIAKLIKLYLKYPMDHVAVYWLRYYPGTKIIKIASDIGILSKKRRDWIEQGENDLSFLKPDKKTSSEIFYMGNLLQVCMLLPKSIVLWFLKDSKHLRLIPKCTLYFVATLLMTIKSVLFKGKTRIYLHTCPFSFFKHYLQYTVKKIFCLPGKKFIGEALHTSSKKKLVVSR